MQPNPPFERMSPQDLVDELKKLLGKSIQGNLQLMNRISALLKAAKERGAYRPANGGHSTASELLQKWIKLNLASYSALTDHSLAFLNELLSEAEATFEVVPPREGQGAQEGREPVEIRVSGCRGETVTAQFAVENKHSSALEVSFQASDLHSSQGGIIPRSLVSFHPPHLTLQPGGEAVVRIAVTITSDFVIGEIYRSMIATLGYQARQIALFITVLPGDTEGQGSQVRGEATRGDAAPPSVE